METKYDGLRERKKRQTREEIANVATMMFAERGFENVTIAEVATAVGVAKMTVTNHFPLKEDLVFDRAEHIVHGLPEAIAARPEGEPVLAAARRYHAERLAAGDPTIGHLGANFSRLVLASPALTARERQIHDQREEALAEVLVAQATPGEELTARVVAAQIAGAYRVVYYTGRRLLLEGLQGPEMVQTLGAVAQRAFALLEADLSGFDPRPRLRSTP
ncbi:TetR/AcrR family transcriptional regulator [Catenulispora sp. NF23]|uniref:TetR/AcrR family transcriptional regulator n=1 Tax=Catenulispora pinistramenti TaxID=2705254 RepID=A0ABS5L4N6_9ACTN|nr:TetR/AcrR family transcriptional regulator [Catenulispora pinistramenti]MBS2537407.1 TetR/AcrR family transcriptional regulator [Catenulispora pinistramenti]MBS2553306.1 TetR/AcrR family transcriptional regulator [Catenulispora pinistramenti]